MNRRPIGLLLTTRLLVAAIAVMLGFDWLVTQAGLAYKLSPATSGDVGGLLALTLVLLYAIYRTARRLL